jgi:aminoglycoside 6-adenylyltransferase
VGSRARDEQAADEWADLDLLIITTKPEYYISDSQWVEKMGIPILTFTESTATGNEKERRVLYDGMLDVDFAMFPVELMQLLETKLDAQIANQLANALGRGMRIIVDREGITPKLQSLIASIGRPAPAKPTQGEFSEVVNDFLYHSVWTAKHLKRGELWWALTCLNCRLPHLLLQMIEWHAQATEDHDYDTWFRGRFLEKWADPRIVKGLVHSIARYDMHDAENALISVTGLFREVAMETAEKLEYSYPREAHQQVAEWLTNVFLR